MRKKYIFPLCLLTAVIVSVSCGCEKQNDISDNSLDVSANNGKHYYVITEANGFLKCDDKENLIVYAEKDGEKITRKGDTEYATVSVNFPGYLVKGNSVYSKRFNFTVPENWEIEDGENLKIKYKGKDTSAEITFVERISESKKECISNIKKTMSVLDIKPEKRAEKNSFGETDVLTYRQYRENTDVSFYVFTVKNKTYYFKITASGNAENILDYSMIINNIKFR